MSMETMKLLKVLWFVWHKGYFSGCQSRANFKLFVDVSVRKHANKFNLGCLMFLVRHYLLWVYCCVQLNLSAWVPLCCLFVVQIFKCQIIAQGWGNGKAPKKSRNPLKPVVSSSGSRLEQAPCWRHCLGTWAASRAVDSEERWARKTF